MPKQVTRRHFMRMSAGAGGIGGLGNWAALMPFGPVTAAETHVTLDLVRFSPPIEPLVKLIEKTPRAKCIPVMVEHLSKGLSYRHFLAGLYLAAVRAATWHSGGQVHAYDHNAYLVHSVHQLSLDLPDSERLLPVFYALDNFKQMQEVYPNRVQTTALNGSLPAPGKAVDELRASMTKWDSDRAERAVVALLRSQGTRQVLEPLWHYAGRDWRFIGHMAILVANSSRLLETIGWRHAEHVLRYVVGGLAGWPRDDAAGPDKQPYPANLERVKRAVSQLPGDWAGNAANAGLTITLLGLFREGKGNEACDLAAQHLRTGEAQAGAIWDAVHLAAGELVLSSKPFVSHQQTNGDALHANTAANALHYAFRASTVAETRLLLTLQALAWMSLYRDLTKNKKLLNEEIRITALGGAELPASPEAAIDQILASRTTKPLEAARLAFAFEQRHGGDEPLLQAARRLLPLKASGDPHDIKFPVAISEDLELVSPEWRPHLLAAAVFSFWGSDRPENPVILQVRDAIRGL